MHCPLTIQTHKKLNQSALLSILFVLLFFASANGQTPTWEWMSRVGSTSNDQGKSITRDKDGNYYVAADFAGTISVGAASYTSFGGIDVVVIKYNAAGQLQWSRQMGSTGDDAATHIYADSVGSLYFTGTFLGASFQYGAGTLTNTTTNRFEIFVVRMNTSGTVLWGQSLKGSGNDYAGKLVSNGKTIFLTGSFQSISLQVGSITLPNPGFRSVLLTAIDSSGTAQWLKAFGGSNVDQGIGISLDRNSNIYLAGNIGSSSLTFGSFTIPGPSVAAQFDVFLTKFDALGTAQWAKVIAGATVEECSDLETDENGNSWLAGYFRSTSLSFGAVSLANPGALEQLFIARYDASGSLSWAHKTANDVSSRAVDISLANNSQAYLTGYFSGGSIQFDQLVPNAGGQDAFVALYTNVGLPVWSERLSGTGDDRSAAIAAGTCGAMVTGAFKSSILSAGSKTVNNIDATSFDVFNALLAKSFTYQLPSDTLRVCGDNEIIDAGMGYNSYSWNTGEITRTITADISGTYQVRVFNTTGCFGEDKVYASFAKARILNNDTLICKGASVQLYMDSSFLKGRFGFSSSKPMNNFWTIGVNGIPDQRIRMVVDGTWLPTNWIGQRLDAAFMYNPGTQALIRPWVFPADQPAPFLLNGAALRPTIDTYRTDHTYEYNFITTSTSFNLVFSDPAIYTDNVGTLNFSLYEMNNPTTVNWSTGATGYSLNVAPLVTTTYYVTVTDGITVCKDSITVTVLEAPITVLPDTLKVCGDSVELDAGAGAASYRWSNGATTQKITVLAGGKYYVNASNSIGCTTVDSVFVSLVKANIQQADTSICRFASLPLTAFTAPGYSYAWSTGASNSSIVVSPTVDTRYYLTVSDGYGSCRDSIQVNLLALPQPSLPDTIKVCGTTVQLDAGAGFATYSWSNGATTQTISVNNSGKYYVDVTGTACPNRDSVYVSLVRADIAQNDTAICTNSSLTLSAVPSVGVSYAWSTGSAASSVVVTPASNQKYFLTVSDGVQSCKDSIQVNVLALPQAALSDTSKSCTASVLLDAGAGIASYNWSTGATGQTLSVSASGKYRVTVTDANGCANTDSAWVSIVKADIIQNDTAVCRNSILSVTAYTQPGFSYLWSTGATSTSIAVPITTLQRFYLQVTDGTTVCTDSLLADIIVLDTTVTSTGSPVFCAGQSILLQARAGYTYSWYRNGAAIAGANQQQYTATQSGDYKVLITNSAGCTDSSFARTIQVNPLPSVSLNTSGVVTICEGTSYQLTATVAGPVQFQWLFNGNPIAGATLAQYDATLAGTYTVKVVNSSGCGIESSSVTVAIAPKPVISFPAGTAVVICDGAAQTINAVITTGTSSLAGLQWYKDAVLIPGAQSPSLTVTLAGSYTLSATSSNGCISISSPVVVTVSSLPVVTLVAPAVTKICRGVFTTITASGASTYEWYKDGQKITGANSATYDASEAGTYTVKGISAGGCASFAPGTVSLSVIEVPKPDFSVSAGCAGSATSFTNLTTTDPSDAVTYTWSSGDGSLYNTVDAQHVYARGGNYIVRLTATSTACPFAPVSKSAPLTVEQARAGISYSPINAVVGRAVPLDARSFGVSYNWSPAMGLSNPRIKNPTATVSAPETYTVTITTASGCVTVDTQLVRVFKEREIYVPTGFTPNGDGRNDRLYPILAGVTQLNYFRVYNRWGNLVFETKSAAASSGWDGTWKGQGQPVETYVWVAEGIDIDGKTVKRNGTTLLIR